MKKTILITGASSGIGKATAKLFQEKGWNVIATMRTPESEKELTILDNIFVKRLDVLDQKSIKEAIKFGIEKFGKIDVLLNNAGYGAFGPLEATSREKIVRQFNVNVMGVLDVTKEILPHFRKNRDGILINISSIGGKMTFPLGSLYHGTKFAIEGISEALSFELGQIGCKVKIVEPGMINTDFAGRSFDFNNDENLSEYQEMVGTLNSVMVSLAENSSDPSLVANVIYEASTDGTDRLRYTAGEDARVLMENRSKFNDAEFFSSIRSQFGI